MFGATLTDQRVVAALAVEHVVAVIAVDRVQLVAGEADRRGGREVVRDRNRLLAGAERELADA